MSRVLIIRPGALGDSILTLPILHAFGLAGVSNVTVLGTPSSWRFLNPSVRGLAIRDFSSSEFLGFFNAANDDTLDQWLSQFDLAVVYLSGDVGPLKQVLKRAGVKSTIHANPPLESSPTKIHASRQLLEPVEHILGSNICGQALQILDARTDPFLGPIEKSSFEIEPGFVAIHPGSGGLKKCWPARYFAALVAELEDRGEKPIVIFGPADDKVKMVFFSALAVESKSRRVENLPLRELMALLMNARMYVGNDSGVSHLAARVCPVLSIFGHTDSRVWAPLGNVSEVIQAPSGDLDQLGVTEILNRLSAL